MKTESSSIARPSRKKIGEEPVFEVRGITKVDHQGEVEVRALRGIDLQIYEKAVLSAIGEGETELANLSAETQRLAIVQRARTATDDAVRRVRENAKAGAISQYEVLGEEQALRDAEITEIRVKAQMLQVWVRLHKALGGGWR